MDFSKVFKDASDLLAGAANAISVISALAVLVAILAWWLNGRLVKAGIYASIWTDHDKRRATVELIRVSSRFGAILLKPIKRPSNLGTYDVSCRYSSWGSRILAGSWSRPGYKGLVQFTYHQNNKTFVGRWVGPDREGNIRSGDWTIKYLCSPKTNHWYLFWYAPLVDFLQTSLEVLFSLPAVAQNLESFKNSIPESEVSDVEGVLIKNTPGVFNPAFGSITRAVLEQSKAYVKSDSYVLDLGTGSGFYAISIAKQFGCRVVAVDCDNAALNSARVNAELNGVSHLIEFCLCPEKDLFSWVRFEHKFDLVVANLPLSSVRRMWKMRKSPYYKSFCGSRSLLIQTILGLPALVKPSGVFLLAHGDSGYGNLLNLLLETSPWTARTAHQFVGKFDTLRVIAMDFSPFISALEEELSTAGTKATLEGIRTGAYRSAQRV